MQEAPTIIIIYGPTGIGKSNYAIQLAKELNTGIICADSRQIYQQLLIGAASPSASDKNIVPHYLFNEIPLTSPITVTEYVHLVKQVITNLNSKYVLLVGGTGFYIDTLIYGMNELPEISAGVRQLVKQYEMQGLNALQEILRNKDPEAYETIDINNPRRIVRALELILQTEKSLSEIWNPEELTKPKYKHIPIYIYNEREVLYERINTRVETMIENGLISEASNLHHLKGLRVLDTVGYQELFDYFDQKITLDEVIRLIKRNSRRYAKRQITWYRRNPDKWNAIHSKDLNNYLTENALKDLKLFEP